MPIAVRVSRRSFYIDVLRSCACVMVVMSHVFAPICASFNSYPAAQWNVVNLLDSLIRPSAALYVMISGKIFLGSTREDSYGQFIWKRYARLMPPFFVWSMIYAYHEAIKDGDMLSWHAALMKFIEGPTAYHLWFMYMILGLYLLMPMMKKFVQHASRRDVAYALGLWFLFLSVQFFAPDFIGSGPLYLLVSYGGYALLGYALDQYDFSGQRPAIWGLAWFGILLFNAAGTYWLTLTHNGVLDERFYFGAAPLVALQGAAMFVLLKRCDDQSFLYRNKASRWTLNHFSRHSYNIYLSHALFIALFTQGDLGFALSEQTGASPWIGVPLTTAAVLACSLSLSMILQRMPILSRLLVIPTSSPSTAEPQAQPTFTA